MANDKRTFSVQVFNADPNTPQAVKEILENNYKDVGTYTMIWDAAGFASGIYYVQLSAGNLVETQKVMLVK